MDDYKACKICNKYKAVEKFYKKKNGYIGLICKHCRLIRDKELIQNPLKYKCIRCHFEGLRAEFFRVGKNARCKPCNIKKMAEPKPIQPQPTYYYSEPIRIY